MTTTNKKQKVGDFKHRKFYKDGKILVNVYLKNKRLVAGSFRCFDDDAYVNYAVEEMYLIYWDVYGVEAQGMLFGIGDQEPMNIKEWRRIYN